MRIARKDMHRELKSPDDEHTALPNVIMSDGRSGSNHSPFAVVF